MSYGSDFVSADPANAPLDPPLLVGADPVLWLALGLLLLAAGLFGWWLGVSSRAHEGDATPAIWRAIDKAAKEAMKADDLALRGRAQHLLETIDRRLGRTLAAVVAVSVADPGLAGRVGDLRAAVAGRPAHRHGHGHGDGDDHADHDGAGGTHDSPDLGEHGGSSAADDHRAEGPRASAVGAAITINVAGAPGRSDGPDARRPRHREMTAREQTDALRLAVAAFNEHWRHESRRVAELRAALAELTGVGERGSRLSRG